MEEEGMEGSAHSSMNELLSFVRRTTYTVGELDGKKEEVVAVGSDEEGWSREGHIIKTQNGCATTNDHQGISWEQALVRSLLSVGLSVEESIGTCLRLLMACYACRKCYLVRPPTGCLRDFRKHTIGMFGVIR